MRRYPSSLRLTNVNVPPSPENAGAKPLIVVRCPLAVAMIVKVRGAAR